eukprot:TRINITY_DN3531_c0_g1_i2.p1 TRINITY_DN3531_c0_g1~~TRINITY_DN3531_c0_g1_i2.p1  ORF type:complete len:280 (+),score=40.83 TRINITY_DN3531_c0_g1_i2:158-997(+)
MCIRDRCIAICLLSPDPRCIVVGIQAVAAHWLGFALSLLFGTDNHFDVTEDVAYLMIMVWNYTTIEGPPSLRHKLVFGCAMLWCVRLCCFVGWRIWVRGADWRFSKLAQARAYNLFGWTSGGTWCWANGFCLWALADVPGSAQGPLDWLDMLGLTLFAAGFTVEIVADLQKYRFNRDVRPGENEKWIDTGLWRFSRHPNYAGEIILWTGLAIVCLGGFYGVRVGSWRDIALCTVTPVWSFLFLLFTSLMLLEKRADSRWGGLPRYEAYKFSTPVLFPGL